MTLSSAEILTLQALRAGPMDTSDLNDRFPSGHAAARLIKKGLADIKSGMYTITALGRELCPARRSKLQRTEEQPEKTTVNKVETIQLHAAIKTDFSTLESPVFAAQNQEKNMTLVADQLDTNVTEKGSIEQSGNNLNKQIVDFVILKNQVTKQQIYDAFSDRRKEATKRTSALIINGVLKFVDGYVRVGMNANRYLARNATKPEKAQPVPKGKMVAYQDIAQPTRVRAPAKQQQAAANMAINASESLNAPELPKVFDAPVIDIDKVYQSLNIPKPTLMPASTTEPKAKPFRVAYTNDGCLMLMGLNDYGVPIELSPAQTKDLVDFVYGMDLETQA